MPLAACSSVTLTSLSAKVGVPSAFMHAVTMAILRRPCQVAMRLILLKVGELTFQTDDLFFVFLGGVESPFQSRLPAAQGGAGVLQALAETLKLRLRAQTWRWRRRGNAQD